MLATIAKNVAYSAAITRRGLALSAIRRTINAKLEVARELPLAEQLAIIDADLPEAKERNNANVSVDTSTALSTLIAARARVQE